MKYEVSLCCPFCAEQEVVTIDLPAGWQARLSGVGVETNTFCPRHSAVKHFTDAQCVGCVSGWGECPMWQAFAFSGRKSITAGDLEQLRKGLCPKRTNGTFSMSAAGIEDINLSEEAIEGGQAFADAIEEYLIEYADIR